MTVHQVLMMRSSLDPALYLRLHLRPHLHSRPAMFSGNHDRKRRPVVR